MPAASLDRSVLFADIAGSSKIYELLGDDAARQRIMELFNALSEMVHQYSGEFLRTYGDELMCAFGAADDAVAAAANMHQFIDRCPPVQHEKIGVIGLYIRIDTGAVIREGNKIFGNTVNSAAKMKTLAKPFQTLISETTRNALSQHHKSMTRFIGKLPIKGKSGTHDIYEYLYEEESITLVTDCSRQESVQLASLALVCDSNTYTIDENQSTLTIGRLPANNIVLNYPGVSRMHAKIEHRNGKFVLVDVSANGTYVHASGCDPAYIKRDEYQLVGNGTIRAMGQASAHTSGVIRYVIYP